MPAAHWSNRTHTREQAYNYCKKEETKVLPEQLYSNFTLEATVQGERSDLVDARSIILSHTKWADIVNDPNPVMEKALKKFYKWCSAVHHARPIAVDVDFIYRPWQAELVSKLLVEPDSRQILWYYDEEGFQGKSWMKKHLAANYGALCLSGGKTADIAHVLDNHRIVIWDLAKAKDPQSVNYEVMEDVKNGCIFSPKYDSCVKHFEVPHVVVFANFICPDGKFSKDRIKLIILKALYKYDATHPPKKRVKITHDNKIIYSSHSDSPQYKVNKLTDMFDNSITTAECNMYKPNNNEIYDL